MHGGNRRLAGIAGAVAIWCMAAPTGAGAAATCAHTAPTHVLAVVLDGDETDISVDSGTIEVESGSVVCAGATPTNTNTDKVVITDANVDGESDVRIFGEGFAPGFSGSGLDIGEATDEIEFEVTLDGADDDGLSYLDDSSTVDDIVVGRKGINPNAGESEVEPDADIDFTGVQDLFVQVRGGAESIDARGGSGTGKAFNRKIAMQGGGSETEPDRLFGGPKADRLILGDGGGKAVGGDGADELVGDASDPAEDRLIGGDGDDILTGESGADILLGKAGRDLLDAKDEEADTKIDCGKGDDEKAKRDGGLDPAPISC